MRSDPRHVDRLYPDRASIDRLSPGEKRALARVNGRGAVIPAGRRGRRRVSLGRSLLALQYRWMRRAGICVVSLAVIFLLAAAGLWLLLANGPVSLDIVTPWIADAVAENLGGRYQVDIGGTVLEYDEHDRPALRIRAITVRDHDGTVVASAPKAEVGFSGASLLSGRPRAERLNLVGAELAIRVEPDGKIKMSTGDPPAAAAPQPSRSTPLAPLSAGAGALTTTGTNSADNPGGVPETLAAFLAWVDSLRAFGLDGGDLSEVGLKSGNLVVDDMRNGQQSRFENIHLILTRPYAGALEFELGSEDPSHPWLLVAEIKPGNEGGRTIDLEARQVLLKDLLLAARVDGGQIDTDIPMSSRIRAELAADGHPYLVSGRVELGRGSIVDTGDPAAKITIDRAQAQVDWSASERLLTIPFEVRSGATRLTLTAQAMAPTEPNGSWTLNLASTGPTVLAPASKGEQPLVLNRVSLQGAIDQAARRFSIDRAEVVGKGVGIAISGSLDYSTSDPRLNVQLTTRKLPLSAFKAVWPPLITPPVRAWIVERSSGGMIEQGEITTNAPLSTLRSGGPPVPDDGLSIEIHATGATVQAFDNLPEIRDVDLVSHTRGQSVTITLAHGTVALSPGRKLVMSNGALEVADTSVKNPPAKVHARVDGPVAAAAELLSMDRLKDAAGIAIDPAASRGNVSATVNLGMRLGLDITSSNLSYAIAADVTNFAADHLVMAQKVEAQALHVVASNQGAQIKGDVRIAGTPAAVDLHRGPDEADAEVHLTCTLDDAARARLGLDSGGAVTGPVGIKINGRLAPSGNADSHLGIEADFTQARLDNLVPGWIKAPKTPAKASFTYIGRGKPVRIEDIAFDGNGASVRGAMEFNANGEFLTGTFPTFGLSEGDKTTVQVERTPDNAYKVIVRGDTFDARNFIRASMSGGAEPKQRRAPFDVDADIKVGAVAGGMGEILRNLDVRLSRRGDTIRSFAATARFAGDGVLQGDLQPKPGSAPVLFIQSSDAGALFRFSNTYSRMFGGQMYIAMDPPTHDGEKKEGVIEVRDFTVRGEPALDNLAAHAPNGASYGVPFTRMRVAFTRQPGRMTIQKGVAAGPIVGGTIEGVMDYAGNDLHLRGTFVPLYGLNTAFAEVPLVGPLFGGAKGMIGSMNYEVTGTPGAPVLRVNPISAVAPGFTKEILDAMSSPPSRPPTATRDYPLR
ncbi:MAG: hypothetical protein J2P53_02850 [Bradyrhizobiaceae bacterium]|nr:hypothetical protein [Bradyrhizobiaceae bacterium]